MKSFCTSAAVFLVLAIAAACPLAGQAADAVAASQAQADAFLSQAESLLASGDTARAASMAASALELAPRYSEALYLSARIEGASRPSTRAAMDHLRAALDSGTWSRTDPLAAEQLLTRLLIRTGQLSEARKSAERLASVRSEDPENFILLVRAYDRAGAPAAQADAADGLRRFPQNDELRLLGARLLQQQGRNAEAAALVRTGLLLHAASPGLLLASAGLEIDRERKIAEINQYLAAGGADPLSAVLGMEAVPVGQRKKYLDLFISLAGLSRQDLVARAVDALKGSADLTARLRDEMSRYTGNRDLDEDSDGAWEDRWTFENGNIVRWVREPAQDGVAQYTAQFHNGLPVSLEIRDSAGSVTRLTYSRYPSIEKAELPGEGTFSLVPYTIQCAFLRPGFIDNRPGTAPRIASRFTVPAADLLRRGAFQLVQYAADGVTVIRRIDLAGGQRVFMAESSAGDGILDHRVWYSHGQPQRGRRSLLPDGAFQVAEIWKDGRLASEAIDTNGDGVPEYRESYVPVLIKSWDFNEDGKDDSREYALPDGRRVRELSTKLNGVFDVSIVSQGTRIVSVSRSGGQLPVEPDASRGVTWIGRPAPAAGKPDLGTPDGIQVIAGSTYFVFRFADVVYAEALQE